ncbi:MAG: Hsp20/alpha crystallin family protein [Phycisphaerales bacterium]|nr:MAG: Hsp20/alpha crystallin family protein [Phycisphaerales bacterium]
MPFRPLQDVPASLGGLQEEMNRLFDQVWHGGLSTRPFDGQECAPPIDLFEHDDRYLLHVEVPGVDAAAVDVSYVGSTLTIRGEKSAPGDEQGRRIRGERRFGTFCRTVELPGDIDADRLSAKCSAGILQISIPKTESSRPKAVKIEVVEG